MYIGGSPRPPPLSNTTSNSEMTINPLNANSNPLSTTSNPLSANSNRERSNQRLITLNFDTEANNQS